MALEQTNLTRERFKFFTRKQETDETLEAFVAVLKNLSLSCELGELQDALVKDVMICGLVEERLRNHLLDEDPANIEEACKAAKQTEIPENKITKSAKRRRRKVGCEKCGETHRGSACEVKEEADNRSISPSNCLSVEFNDERDSDVPLSTVTQRKKISTPEKPSDPDARKHNGNNKLRKGMRCHYCSQEFSSQFNLDAHSRSHFRHSCKHCQKRFRYRHHLTRHERIHTGERPHMCSECGKCFIQESALYLHTRTHTGERPFMCNYCEKHFRQKLYLTVHMRIHTGEKPHQCHFCGKCFSQKSTLNVHVRSHTGETPYQCECGRAFAHKVDYNTHVLSHSGETPHTCAECGKSFSTKAVLKKHTIKHTGERPFKCETCCKSFSFKHHLVRHARLHGDGVAIPTVL